MSKKDRATKNSEDNNTTTIIFHRSAENAREAKITQEMFILDYNRNYPYSESVEVIDYVTGDHELAREINEIILDSPKKPVVIVNSSITAREYDEEYDMYSRFCGLSKNGKIELYLMDSRGELYKKVDCSGRALL